MMYEIPSLLGTALDMAESGIAVFPLPALSKAPNNHGNEDSLNVAGPVSVMWQDTSSKWKTRVREWYSEPERNIGIDCEKSNLWVVDIDTKHGDGVREFTALCRVHGDGKWPETFTVRTASGGYHLYFEAGDHALRNTKGLLAPNIDTRGVGGYVVGWDSVVLHKGELRAYEVVHEAEFLPIPEWLAKVSSSLQAAQDAKSVLKANRVRLELRMLTASEAEKKIDSLTDYLANTFEGDRNQVLHWTSCRFGELAAAGWITEEDAEANVEFACEHNGLAYDDGLHSVRATFRSGFRRGYTGLRPV